MRSFDETVAIHDRAVAEYVAAAERVTSWDASPKPGKWSAAQITAHLNLAFEAILCEMNGGPPMALRTKWLPRFLLRHTIMRRLMKGGAFPHGAPAPRETRPPDAMGDRESAVAEFRRLAAEVKNALVAHGRGARFRHPYFGYVSALDGMYISARHIDHHRTQIIGR